MHTHTVFLTVPIKPGTNADASCDPFVCTSVPTWAVDCDIFSTFEKDRGKSMCGGGLPCQAVTSATICSDTSQSLAAIASSRP